MKIRHLIDTLSALDPDLDIKVSTDPEGNGFYGLSGIQEMYVEHPVDNWYHEEAHDESDFADHESDDSDTYVPGEYVKVLVLWP